MMTFMLILGTTAGALAMLALSKLAALANKGIVSSQRSFCYHREAITFENDVMMWFDQHPEDFELVDVKTSHLITDYWKITVKYRSLKGRQVVFNHTSRYKDICEIAKTANDAVK